MTRKAQRPMLIPPQQYNQNRRRRETHGIASTLEASYAQSHALINAPDGSLVAPRLSLPLALPFTTTGDMLAYLNPAEKNWHNRQGHVVRKGSQADVHVMVLRSILKELQYNYELLADADAISGQQADASIDAVHVSWDALDTEPLRAYVELPLWLLELWSINHITLEHSNDPELKNVQARFNVGLLYPVDDWNSYVINLEYSVPPLQAGWRTYRVLPSYRLGWCQLYTGVTPHQQSIYVEDEFKIATVVSDFGAPLLDPARPGFIAHLNIA